MIQGETIALIGVFVNIFLGFAKYLLGCISGSLSLKADAFHSFLDILISLLIFVGLKITQRKSKNFPFGLHKIENLLSLFIGVIMILAGIEIIKEAIFSPSILKGERVPFTSAVILTLAVINGLWARYKIKAGKEIPSPSITSDGYHSCIDSLTLFLISLGLLGNDMMRFLPIDTLLAVFISLSIFRVSLTIMWDAVKVLLDGTVDQAIYHDVQTILTAHSMVDSVRELLIRQSGKYLYIEVVILLKCNNIDLATNIKNELQDMLRNKMNNIERITIDYVKSGKTVLAIMTDNVDGEISRNLANAPYIFLLTKLSEKNMEVIPNPIIELKKQKGIRLVNFLKEHDVDTVVTRGNMQNTGILALLQNAGIKYVSLSCENIREFLRTYGNQTDR